MKGVGYRRKRKWARQLFKKSLVNSQSAKSRLTEVKQVACISQLLPVVKQASPVSKHPQWTSPQPSSSEKRLLPNRVPSSRGQRISNYRVRRTFTIVQTWKISMMLHPCQHLALSVFLVVDILGTVKVARGFKLHFYSNFLCCAYFHHNIFISLFSLVRCLLRILGCFINLLLSFKSFLCFGK